MAVKKKLQLRVSVFESSAEVRESTEKGASGDIWSVPKEGCTIRFITEPEEWIGYWEFYDEDSKSYVPMADGDEVPKGSRPSFRYLANVIFTSEGSRQGQVTPFKMPKSVATSLLNKFDKYGTLTDRDYEIIKTGEGLKTEYDVTPEDKSKMSLVAARKEAQDLIDVLTEERDRVMSAPKSKARDDEADDEDEDEEEVKPTRSKSKAKPPARGKTTEVEEEEEEEEDEVDLAELGALADDDEDDDAMEALMELAIEFDLAPDDYPTWAELAEAIAEAAEGGEDEDEEEEEPEEEEEEEEVEIDEDSLGEMSVAALKKLAGEYEIDIDGLRKKDDIIQAILEAAEE